MGKDVATIQNLIAQDRFVEALRECDEVLRREPGNVEVIAQKAWILGSPMPELSDPERAVALLKSALENNPDSAELHSVLAYVYEVGLGEYTLAAQEYKTAIGLRSDDARSYLALALLLGAPGSGISLDEAIDYLERGVVVAPSDWQLRRELALLHWRSGNRSRAEVEFEAALACQAEPVESSREQIQQWLQKVRAGVPYTEGFVSKVR